MKFKAQTEKEIAEANLIPAGIYPFRVIDAKESKSKKGNDMIEMELQLFMPDNRARSLTVYLMQAMPAQLFHFCSLCGLQDEYETGSLSSEHCVDKTGYVSVGIQKGKPKDDSPTENWPDRNNVKDFVKAPSSTTPPAETSITTIMKPEAKKLDEDVPY